jgi:hypothetical protein
MRGLGHGWSVGLSEVHSYVVEYRRCIRAEGVTWPIAVCTTCRRIIEPRAIEPSKTGAHGKLYFVHQHPLVFITLLQSNSGKRRVALSGELGELARAVEQAWVVERASVDEVVELARSLMADSLAP